MVCSSLFRRMLLLPLSLALLFAPAGASAITITYVNPGPLDSRVFVGFANDASGNLTSDLVIDPSAASRNDTLYGPLPAPGDLPSFDAMVYGASELGTNLNAPLGTGVRSVFAPLNLTFFQAHGQTLAGTGTYSSDAYAFSGDTTSTSPTRWIVHVDPSGSEVAGTPAQVTVTGSIAGYVDAAGSSVSDALWNVATTTHGTVMSGTANQSTPGTSNFSDAGTLNFTIPLGTTFELLVDYDLSTSGSGAGANSTSEITSSLVEISALIPPPVAPLYAVSFLVPIFNGTTFATPAGPFQRNRPIPVLLELRNAKGDLISDREARKLDVRIAVFPESKAGSGDPIELKPKPRRIDDTFRYNAGHNVFIYTLNTRGPAWQDGQTYRIEVSIDGAHAADAFFSLR